MKKVFLLLTSAMFGVAAMASDPITVKYDEDDNVTSLSVPYNMYGEGSTSTKPEANDADAISDQWQGYDATLLTAAYADLTGSTKWGAQIGDKFLFSMAGTADFTGTVQFFIVDERAEVGYWAELSESAAEFEVVKGEPFETSFVLKIARNEKEGTALTEPHFIVGLKLGEYYWSSNWETNGISSNDEWTLSFTSFEYAYGAPVDYENPMEFTLKGKADNEADGFKYQAGEKSAVSSTKDKKYVNVELSGTAQNDIDQLMYGLIYTNQAEGVNWFKTADDMAVIKRDIKKGDKVNEKFSVAIEAFPEEKEGGQYNDVFLATSQAKELALYLSGATVKATVSETPTYKIPTAVEEVAAADFAIEGGMVYSAGVITVYDVTGKVVATASQEFNVNTLAPGAYAIVAEEGTIKFVK